MGTALGLFNLGPPIGQALGVAFGAKIAAAYDWRLAFTLLGAAGLIAAAVPCGGSFASRNAVPPMCTRAQAPTRIMRKRS